MLYKYEVMTEGGLPHAWPRDAPKEMRVNLASGVVEQVMIEFPAGCLGLVGCRISRGLNQLWPMTGHEWFISDDFIVDFREKYVLDEGPCILRIETFSEDDEYDHTLKVSFSIVEDKPDPIAQMVEIAKRIAKTKPDLTGGIPIEVQQAVLDIRDLLYIIHTSDLPMLYQAIATLRR